RKSPAIKPFTSAVSHISTTRNETVAKLRHEHVERETAAKIAQKQWREQVEAAKKEGKVPPAMPLEARIPGPFVVPRLYVTNATTEKLAVLLLARPRGMYNVVDELADLFANMGRYSRGRDDAFWLKAWTGGPEVYERMGREA